MNTLKEVETKTLVAAGDNQSSSEAFMQDFFSLTDKAPAKPEANQEMAAQNIGQVKELALPNNWIEIPSRPSLDGSTFSAYQDKKHPDAKLCFFYRGQKMDENSAQEFHSLLSKPDHILTNAEFQAMAPIMRNKDNPDDFKLESAYTSTINGKRVLAVEGRFTPQDIDTIALYVDSDNKGSAVQEIYYQGPKKELVSKVEARKAMKEINWQNDAKSISLPEYHQ
jgi:hypothetical protein